jgi:hypothetical protein
MAQALADQARRRLKAVARRMGAISRSAAREAMTPSDSYRHHPVCPGGEPILEGGAVFVRVEGRAGRKVLRPWVTCRMRSPDQTADGSCTPGLLEECSHHLYASYRDEKAGQKHGGEDKKPTRHFIEARVSQHHGVTSRQRDGDKYGTGTTHDEPGYSGGSLEDQGLRASQFPQQDQDGRNEYDGSHESVHRSLPLDVFVDPLPTEPGCMMWSLVSAIRRGT